MDNNTQNALKARPDVARQYGAPASKPTPKPATPAPKDTGDALSKAYGGFAPTESVTYSEEPTLARIVHLAGL
jgi:hypothetical protein